MNFEVLKKNHLKRNILIAVVVVLILSAVILTFTKAKYRTTQSMPLLQGTINFSPSDLNLMAVYLNKNGETLSSDKVPHVGYTLNTDLSICEVNDVEDLETEIIYENGYLYVNKLSHKGTKCTAYFDLIPDSEKPVINNINSKSDNDTSVTIEIDATDNVGIYYYYYKIDNEEEIQNIDSTYTFEGLEKDSVHTITVRVEDAAGNEASASEKVTVGYKVKDVILKKYSTILTRTDFTQAVTETTTGTIYKSLNESQYDNDGEVYYFAGNPTDNWFYFGGYYWQIIRINGNGTIRMIFSGNDSIGPVKTGDGTKIGSSAFNNSRDDNKYVGYMYGETSSNYEITHANKNDSTIKIFIDNWYTINLKKYESFLDGNAGFCGDRTVSSGDATLMNNVTFEAYTRISNRNPSFKCTNSNDLYTTITSNNGNKSLLNPIGLISSDELAFAGGGYNIVNNNYYLFTQRAYWTMSPGFSMPIYTDTRVFFSSNTGNVSALTAVDTVNDIRPVINLRADVQITGTGTVDDPFKVVGAS